jgi:hypothetical protein
MIRALLIVAVLISTAAQAQERVTILRDKNGRVTGAIRSSGPRPTAAEGLAILCAGGRCDPAGYAALASTEPQLIPIRSVQPPQADARPDAFKLHPLPPYQPCCDVQTVPLPEPTVRVILEQPIRGKVTTR